MERKILHCDLNNFYASVEQLYHPELRGKPLAVAGRTEDRKGIILAKNMSAKATGVKTGEPIWAARNKCPDLVVITPDFQKYSEFSKRARAIYERYTDMVEAFGPDECWLDVSGSQAEAADIGESIRRDIKAELEVTVSVGVSFNKIFAKLGSDMKKPDAVTVISRENFKTKIWPLPVEELLFVGPATKRHLREMGIFTIGALAAARRELLVHKFGKNGLLLSRYARGEDASPVTKTYFREEPKSIGNSRTFPADITTAEEVCSGLVMIAEEVGRRLRKAGFLAGGLSLWVKDDKLSARQFDRMIDPTDKSGELAKAAFCLFVSDFPQGMRVRSLGIRAYRLMGEADFPQIAIDDYMRERSKNNAQDRIKERFGSSAVTVASVLGKNLFEEGSPAVFGAIPR